MKSKKIRVIRIAVQLLCLALFVWMFTGLSYPLGWKNTVLKWFTRFDPVIMLNWIWGSHQVVTWFVVPMIVVIITILFGRVFCGWFCPFGSFMMIVDRVTEKIIGRKRFRKLAYLRKKVLSKLQPYRWFWFVALLVLFIVGLPVVQLTPFALFSSEINHIIRGCFPIWLALITLLTIAFSRVWCTLICPSGGLFQILSHFRPFRYRMGKNCIKCGSCERVCPVSAINFESGKVNDACLLCGDCSLECPKESVSYGPPAKGVKEEDKTKEEKLPEKKRREFLKLAGIGLITSVVAIKLKSLISPLKTLRPPGAVDENNFNSMCNRCGRCIEVCPNKALHEMPIIYGMENYGTPYMIPREGNCCLCMSCVQACPTGALKPVQIQKIHIGKARVDQSRCIAWKDHKLCLICVEQCPMGGVTQDEKHRPVVNLDKCIGCGSCEKCCALQGEAAIRVFPNEH